MQLVCIAGYFLHFSFNNTVVNTENNKYRHAQSGPAAV